MTVIPSTMPRTQHPLRIQECQHPPEEQVVNRVFEINLNVGLDSFNEGINKHFFEGEVPYQLFVAYKTDIIAGYLLIRPDNTIRNHPNGYHLSFIAVDPKHQKEKIGTRLMETAFKILENAQVTAFKLNCHKTKLTFYRRFSKYLSSVVKNDKHPAGPDMVTVTYYLDSSIS